MTLMVEKNIPMPEEKKRNIYPYKQMDVGDSFFAPEAKITIMCNLQYRVSQKTGMKFTARKEGNGVRVWRTE